MGTCLETSDSSPGASTTPNRQLIGCKVVCSVPSSVYSGTRFYGLKLACAPSKIAVRIDVIAYRRHRPVYELEDRVAPGPLRGGLVD